MQHDAPAQEPDPHAWETAGAPRISTAHMLLVFTVFVIWIGILAWMTVRRWYGSLL